MYFQPCLSSRELAPFEWEVVEETLLNYASTPCERDVSSCRSLLSTSRRIHVVLFIATCRYLRRWKVAFTYFPSDVVRKGAAEAGRELSQYGSEEVLGGESAPNYPCRFADMPCRVCNAANHIWWMLGEHRCRHLLLGTGSKPISRKLTRTELRV